MGKFARLKFNASPPPRVTIRFSKSSVKSPVVRGAWVRWYGRPGRISAWMRASNSENAEGFREIIIPARLEAPDAVIRGRARAQKNHGNAHAFLAQFLHEARPSSFGSMISTTAASLVVVPARTWASSPLTQRSTAKTTLLEAVDHKRSDFGVIFNHHHATPAVSLEDSFEFARISHRLKAPCSWGGWIEIQIMMLRKRTALPAGTISGVGGRHGFRASGQKFNLPWIHPLPRNGCHRRSKV